MFSLPHRSPRDLPFTRDHTALLLVDMQRAWLEVQFDAHLASPEAEYFIRRARQQVIPNQQRLLAAMRAARHNVLHT
ncbi:isochorismatase, partial [Pseudomonas fluorescens]